MSRYPRYETDEARRVVRSSYLHEVEATLADALRRLGASERSERPFVIVENHVTGRFVQFAAYKVGDPRSGVLFDLPVVSLDAEAAKEASRLGEPQGDDVCRAYQLDFVDTEEAARFAITVLHNILRLPDDAAVTIVEQDVVQPS